MSDNSASAADITDQTIPTDSSGCKLEWIDGNFARISGILEELWRWLERNALHRTSTMYVQRRTKLLSNGNTELL